jgi:hypothetical protein
MRLSSASVTPTNAIGHHARLGKAVVRARPPATALRIAVHSGRNGRNGGTDRA